MPNLTCPIPANINPLSSNGFNFSIKKLPEVSYFCQEVALPGISLPTVDVSSSLSNIPVAGEMVTFDELNIQFLVDESMSNYKAVYNWLIGLGFPSDNIEYSNFINAQDTGYSRLSREYSDATLQILSSSNQVSQTVKFIDIIPTSLSGMTFQSTNTDVTYIAGNATFRFTRFEFV